MNASSKSLSHQPCLSRAFHRKSVGRLPLALLAFLIWCTVRAQPLPPEIDSAIEVLATYTAPISDRTDAYLRQRGFDAVAIGIDTTDWNNFTPHRKIAVAYLSAESGKAQGAGAGGKELLALMIEDVKARYDTAILEFKILVGLPPPPEGGSVALKFARGPPPPSALAAIPNDIREVINTLADYTARWSMGDPVKLLQRWFKIDEKMAWDCFMSGSLKESIARGALLKIPEAQRLQSAAYREALALAVADVKAKFSTASHEPVLMTFKGPPETPPSIGGGPSTPPPQPPSASVSGGGGDGGGGEFRRLGETRTNSSVTKETAAYHGFVQKSYSSTRPAFHSVVRSAGGFGGVVFGSEIKAEKSLANFHPQEFAWRPLTTLDGQDLSSRQFGDLVLRDSSGREYHLERVRRDIFDLADRVLHDEFNGEGHIVRPPQDGDAIGLISLHTRINESVVHPALILGRLELAFSTVDRLEPLRQKWPKLDHEPLTWKIIDVPMTISTNAERRLKVEPAVGIAEKAGAARSVYLSAVFWGVPRADYEKAQSEMRKERAAIRKKLSTREITEEQWKESYEKLDGKYIAPLWEKLVPIESLTEAFNIAAPQLIATSEEFALVNDFVRTLTVLRWAKNNRPSK